MVKVIGKAKADAKAGQWMITGKPDRFEMNPRRVDRHPDMKAYKTAIKKHSAKKPPPKKRQDKRDDYFTRSAEFKVELEVLMEKVFAEMLAESFTEPVLLYNKRDFTHNRVVWRFCIYQGMIYEFDKADYSIEQMIEEIETLCQPDTDSPAL